MSGLLSAADWLSITEAYLLGRDDRLDSVVSIVTDSRKAEAGSLFVALAGERACGWDYLDHAYANGCTVFWGPEAASESLVQFWKNHPDTAVLISPDPLNSLQHAARWYLAERTRAYRIGVTGSQGKTTAKEMLRVALSAYGQVYSPQGNLNTVISLPCEIFKIGPEHDYAIFEMGIDRVGEMEVLAEMIRPQAALLTGIGTAHAEFLGGREGIAREKAKIASRMDRTGVFLVPRHDDFYEQVVRGVSANVVGYGYDDVEAGSLEILSWTRTRFRYHNRWVEIPQAGKHFALMAVAVLKLVEFLGHDPGPAIEALAGLKLPGGRSRWIEGDISILDDSYNANPQSVGALLDTLSELPRPNHLVLVLGSMLELGDLSEDAHRQLGRRAASLQPDVLVWVGKEAGLSYEEARPTYLGQHRWYPDAEAALAFLREVVSPGSTLVVKASRGIGLDKIVHHFTQESAHAL